MSRKNEEILKNLIVKLYDELGSGDAVAKRLDISRKTVYRLLHVAGIDLPDRHSPQLYDKRKTLQGDKKKEAIQDYVDGMELKKIFEKYGISSASLYTALKDEEIERRPHGGQARSFKGEDAKEIIRLYTEENLSQLKIAVMFNASQSLISRVLREHGIAVDSTVSGEKHGNWIGGRTITGAGYVQVSIPKDDPLVSMCNRQGYVLEHRLVMARALGRPLTDNETVHHIDGDRENNDLSNLQLRIGKHGKGSVYRCADCGSYHIISTDI